jgi:hypothetical protein
VLIHVLVSVFVMCFVGVDPEVDWSNDLVVRITVLLSNTTFALK